MPSPYWLMVASSWMLSSIAPSPTITSTWASGRAKAAPTAIGTAAPMLRKAAEVISRWEAVNSRVWPVT